MHAPHSPEVPAEGLQPCTKISVWVLKKINVWEVNRILTLVLENFFCHLRKAQLLSHYRHRYSNVKCPD